MFPYIQVRKPSRFCVCNVTACCADHFCITSLLRHESREASGSVMAYSGAAIPGVGIVLNGVAAADQTSVQTLANK